MRVPRFAPSPALVVACLALVVAAAQPVASAVSALVPTNSVGTAQLRDSAVTTPKLHDGAVTNRKIAPSTITGARIANGSVGLVDLAASAHPVPPKAYAAATDLVALPTAGGFAEVAVLDLPAGSWALQGKVAPTTSGNSSFADAVICHLFVGDTSLDFARSYSQAGTVAGQNYSNAIPLAALLTVGAPTRVSLSCSQAGGDGLDAYVQSAKLIAIRVTP